MPSATPLEIHTLLLLLLPPAISQAWARGQRNQPTAVYPNPVPSVSESQVIPAPLPEDSSYKVWDAMFSLWSKVALLKYFICSSATDRSLPNTTAQDILLFSTVLPHFVKELVLPTGSPLASPHLMIALSRLAWHLLKLPTQEVAQQLSPRS